MLAIAAAGLALGIGLSPWLAGNPLGLLALPFLFLLRSRPWLWRLALGLLLIGPASWWAEVRQPVEAASDVAAIAPRRFVRLEGVVATPPVPKNGRWRAEVVVSGSSSYPGRAVTGRVVASWESPARPVVGDRWRFAGRLRRPPAPTNPGEFDYGEFLARRGIFATYAAEEAARLRAEPSWRLWAWLDRLRIRLLAGLGAGLTPGDAALLGSLVVGGGAAPVPEATETAFRRVGLAHMLAASGAQVALLTALLYGGLRRCGLRASWSAFATAPWLVLYLGLTGAPMSMVRATLMGLAALGGLALERKNIPYASLHLTAALMLVAWPTVLQDLGWQFSLLATYGLIRLAGWMEEQRPVGPEWLWGLVLVPVVALAWVSPWQVATFQTWSWWALPANWLTGPLLMAITPWGVGVALVGLVWPGGAAGLNVVSGWLLTLLQRPVYWMAELPGAEVTAPPPALWGLVAVYAALWCGARHPRRAVALGVAAVLLWTPAPRAGELEMVFLSVGQGDAVALRTPGGRWVLVDGGPEGHGFDAGRHVVLPYLRRRGCGRIALMVATHAHQDHVGGLPAIARALPVDRAWDAGQDEEGGGQRALLASWLTRGVPWAIARPGLTWEADGVRLTVLAPRREGESINDGSIVTLVRYGDFRAILTGDMEETGERDLLDTGVDLRCDVLKVGHHGSRTSSSPAWLAATRPSLAVISAGDQNRFGHPHREVVTRLRRAGARVARTDRDGAVIVRTDGRTWRAESFKSSGLADSR